MMKDAPQVRVDIFLPHLRTGGIELNFIRLAPALLARGIALRFVLQDDTGELRGDLPSAIPVVGLNSGGMWATARAYAGLLRTDPPDVTYSATNALNVAHLLARRLARLNGRGAVVGEHIPLAPFLESRKRPWLRRLLMRMTYPKATHVVAPIADILTEHQHILGATCPPVQVLPNPVIQAPTPAPVLANQAQHFVALGRLSVEKGFDLALHMMAAYRTYDPAARLTIYGDGPERAALEKLCDDLGLADRVTFPGRTSDVVGVLAQSDLFICTSQVEGFGNAIVEAQAAGIPVLSVDCPFGPRMLLRDGAAGCLVKSRNAADIARQLADFASDTKARASAQAQAQDVAARYTVAASADAHADFFRAVAA